MYTWRDVSFGLRRRSLSDEEIREVARILGYDPDYVRDASIDELYGELSLFLNRFMSSIGDLDQPIYDPSRATTRPAYATPTAVITDPPDTDPAKAKRAAKKAKAKRAARKAKKAKAKRKGLNRLLPNRPDKKWANMSTDEKLDSLRATIGFVGVIAVIAMVIGVVGLVQNSSKPSYGQVNAIVASKVAAAVNALPKPATQADIDAATAKNKADIAKAFGLTLDNQGQLAGVVAGSPLDQYIQKAATHQSCLQVSQKAANEHPELNIVPSEVCK